MRIRIPKTLSARLGLLTLLLVSGSVVAAAFIASWEIEDFFRQRLIQDLLRQSHEFELLLRQPSPPSYEALARMAGLLGTRLTLVSSSGVVLLDSDVPESRLAALDNHISRPEIVQAQFESHGWNIRHSHTIGTDMLYVARRLESPLPGRPAAFTRVAVPLFDVHQAAVAIRWKTASAGLIALLLATLAVVVSSRRFVKPVAEMAAAAEDIKAGNLDRPIPVERNDEVGRLGIALREMVDKLRADITQMKKLERMRSEFLGNVSHELRTPIFAIQGFIETLVGGAVNDPRVNIEFLKKALDHTTRLNALLNDLIEISRIETGEMKLSLRYFNVGEMLEGIQEEMKPPADQKSIALNLAARPDNATDALGDPERIRQVITNLVDNAIKYTNPGGSVTISAANEAERVRIAVEDTGCGISSDHIPRIFERFYRVDKDRSREAGGTGLGLAIVKHIVEAHGSQVSVVSTPGRGSIFSFALKRR
ncbi:MAG: ATP-binding protein [Acidobacteriota bacterium]